MYASQPIHVKRPNKTLKEINLNMLCQNDVKWAPTHSSIERRDLYCIDHPSLSSDSSSRAHTVCTHSSCSPSTPPVLLKSTYSEQDLREGRGSGVFSPSSVDEEHTILRGMPHLCINFCISHSPRV